MSTCLRDWRPALDDLPLSIGIRAVFLIHPALTGGNQYFKGGFTVDWVGSKSAAANDIGTGGTGSEVLTFTRREHFPRRAQCDGNLVLRVTFGVEGWSTRGPRRFPLPEVGAAAIDLAVDAIEKKSLPAGVYTALKASNAGNVTANILGSGADVIIRVIHTEGATDSSNVTGARAPRSN
jgi:hypothetical protein